MGGKGESKFFLCAEKRWKSDCACQKDRFSSATRREILSRAIYSSLRNNRLKQNQTLSVMPSTSLMRFSGMARLSHRLTLRGAVGFPPGPAIASSLPHSWSFGRFLSATARSSGVLRALFDSDVSSLRFESRSARQRFGPPAEPAIAPTDPDKPWLRPNELATRSFAGSAH